MMANFIAKHRPQTPPSSSGLTGRSSNPRAFDSIASACDYWMPAGACHRAALRADPVAGITKKNEGE
jgi:hypothetical protein